jgi:carboxyl-terminal processing protease
MLPASVNGPGMNMGFPDVCLTPAAPAPIPVPYPNMGMHALAAPFCPTILLQAMPALNMGSMIPLTMGDNAGVANPVFMQLGTFTMSSPKVLLQGMPAITMACTTTGNAMNNPIGGVVVPGIPTILFGYAVPEAPRGAAGPVEASREADGSLRISIHLFTPAVPAAVHDAIGRFTGAAIERLVFDVRDNPGGDVRAALDLLRDLLPEGATVATLEDAEGDVTEYVARGDLYPWPVDVWVGGGTASAAELFAGSLRAHGRARLWGARTYGKSAVRCLIAGNFVDAGRFVLPGGVDAGVGLEPDRPLPPPA